MSLPILKGSAAWPQVLLARAADGDLADIAAAEAAGAWKAYQRAVGELSPEAVIHTVTESGLRGLGGAGHLFVRSARGHCEDVLVVAILALK